MKRRNWFDAVWEDLDLNLEEPLDGWKDGRMGWDGMGREGKGRGEVFMILFFSTKFNFYIWKLSIFCVFEMKCFGDGNGNGNGNDDELMMSDGSRKIQTWERSFWAKQ